MPFVRSWTTDNLAELELAFARLGLPRSARDYLSEKLPHRTLLLTDLSDVERRFLKSRADLSSAPGYEAYPAFIAGDGRTRPGSALLFGRTEQHDRLVAEAEAEPELRGLATALRRVLESLTPPEQFEVGGRSYHRAQAPYLMAVVNVTPDSFSDGGHYFSTEGAVAHGVALAEAGAHFLDVGGESSRPGAEPVSADEELSRVVPVIRALRERTGLPISIDTVKPEVAREALGVGASWVNDITGFANPAMARVTAEANGSCCLMHMQGTPRTMQAAPRYQDCVAEVVAFLEGAVGRAEAAGIPRGRILVDPGIGCGKTLGHNLFLLRRLGDLRGLGLPILVGTSRKTFLGKLTGRVEAKDRLFATLGSLASMAALGGADVVRVHDVAEARDALTVAAAIRSAADGGDAFGG